MTIEDVSSLVPRQKAGCRLGVAVGLIHWFYAAQDLEVLQRTGTRVTHGLLSRDISFCNDTWPRKSSTYPLVNICISMENHHFESENSPFLWPFMFFFPSKSSKTRHLCSDCFSRLQRGVRSSSMT